MSQPKTWLIGMRTTCIGVKAKISSLPENFRFVRTSLATATRKMDGLTFLSQSGLNCAGIESTNLAFLDPGALPAIAGIAFFRCCQACHRYRGRAWESARM